MLLAQGRLATERRQAFGTRAVGRQTVKTGPDALGRPAFQPDRAVGPAQQQPPPFDRAALELARADREFSSPGLRTGQAQTRAGTGAAVRLAARAQARAQVHQALGPGHHLVMTGCCRQQVLRQRPEPALLRQRGQVAVEGQQPRQHALDVAVEDRDPLAEAESRDRRCGRAANAGQGLQLLGAGREGTAPLLDHGLGAAMQVARAAVIAQPAPERQHCLLRRGGQGADIGKTLEEARVIAQHGRDLGLLQHDLGQPDPVGIARALPGQAAAAVAALPLDQAREEKKGRSGQRGVGSGERHEEDEAVRKSGNPGRRRLNAAPGAGSGW